jgi:hypothetical protein
MGTMLICMVVCLATGNFGWGIFFGVLWFISSILSA